ncbi:MAG: YncE family protein [Thermoplasmatota archaeon]
MVFGAVLLIVGGVLLLRYRFLLATELHLSVGEDPLALHLKVVGDIPLEASASRFDYQSMDTVRSLLFVTHLGGDEVVVVDMANETVRGYVAGIASPHGVLAVPALGRAFVSATGSHEIVAIDEASRAVVARTGAGAFPDGLAFDPDSQKLFVSDESGGAVVVLDARTNLVVDRVSLGGTVGNTQYDSVGHQIVAAAEGRGQLVLIDPMTDRVTAWMYLPGCRGPHGVYVNAAERRAYVACEGNARLVDLDLDSHLSVGSFPVGDFPDVLASDPGLGRLYVASESGVVALFRESGGTLAPLGEAFLAPAAHTVAVEGATHRVYFPLEDVGGRPMLRIFAPTDASSGP